MILLDVLTKMLKDEKNAVNRMYLNEIMIKYRKYSKIAEQGAKSDDGLESLSQAISELTNDLNNPKYKYGKTTKGGFNPACQLFSPIYLDDLITLFLQEKNLLDKQGITWGYQKFSQNVKFNPRVSYLNDKAKMLSYDKSNEFLSLVQSIDIQTRISGKRNFEKFQIKYPLLIVQTIKVLREKDIVRLNHQAELIKAKFDSTRIIIVAEVLDHGVSTNIKNSDIDCIILLRKQYATSKKRNKISAESLRQLRDKIYQFITEKEARTPSILETGIVEK